VARNFIETIVWDGGFGRTLIVKGAIDRVHNPQGFTIWQASVGVKRASLMANPTSSDTTLNDNFHMDDLHAPILHLSAPIT